MVPCFKRTQSLYYQVYSFILFNHPKTISEIKNPNDFKKIQYGRCQETFTFQYKFGHFCSRLCHPKVPNHVAFKCQKHCYKKMDCGHECGQLCHFDIKCEPNKCTIMLPFKFTKCDHNTQVRCNYDIKLLKCHQKCNILLPCGHRCQHECLERNHQCECTTYLTSECKDCKRNFRYTIIVEKYLFVIRVV